MTPDSDDRAATQPGAARGSEVRIALVLSGGISLAVYMHGVVQEVLRLQRAARGQAGGGGANAAYRALAERAGIDVLVDIISGTSAGGLNGVLLAKALAAGGNLDGALPLWVDAADITHLLHKAGERAPESLLRPEYFSQQLHSALTGIDATADPHLAQSHPVLDLYVHATDYGGRHVTTADYLGTVLRTRDHRKAFRLRLRRPAGYSGYERNDFYDGRDDGARRRKNELLTRIGMASAALPPAFPTVKLTRAEAGDLMDAADADRVWYADGGIMDNKPFRSALEAIKWRAANRPVDRFIFYVDPHPEEYQSGALPANSAESPPPPPAPPAPLEVVAGYWTLPRYDSIAGSLRDLQDRNRRAEQMRRLIRQAMAAAPGQPRLSPVYGAYLRLRVQNTIEHLAGHLQRALRETPAPAPPDPHGRAAKERAAIGAWRQFLYREAAPDGHETPAALQRWESFLARFDLPFAVRRLYYLTTLISQYHGQTELGDGVCRQLCAVEDGLWQILHRLRQWEWQVWHPFDAEGLPALAEHCTGLLRSLPGGRDELHHLYAHLADLYAGELKKADAGVAAVLQDMPAPGRSPGLATPPRHPAPPVEPEPPTEPEPPGDYAVLMADLLALGPDHPAYPAPAADMRLARSLWTAAEGSEPPPGPEPPRALPDVRSWYDRFAALDLVTYPAARLGDLTEHDSALLVRISPFDARLIDLPGKVKLGGETLAHLGGFLDRDLRANDVLWGRLDAAELIIKAILKRRCEATGDPRHLYAVGPFVRWAQWEILQAELGALERAAVGQMVVTDHVAAAVQAAPPATTWWGRRWAELRDRLPRLAGIWQQLQYRLAAPVQSRLLQKVAVQPNPAWADYVRYLTRRPAPGAREWYHLPGERLLPLAARAMAVAHNMLAAGPQAGGWLGWLQRALIAVTGALRHIGRVLYANWWGWLYRIRLAVMAAAVVAAGTVLLLPLAGGAYPPWLGYAAWAVVIMAAGGLLGWLVPLVIQPTAVVVLFAELALLGSVPSLLWFAGRLALKAEPLWAGAPGWLTEQTLVPGGTALCAALAAYGLVTRVRARRKRPE